MRLPYLLPLLALAAPATAQTADTARGRLELAGQAAPACVIRQASASGGANATFRQTGGASGEIAIAELVDPQTAEPRRAEIALVLPTTCNAAHRLRLSSANGGLLRDGGNARNAQRPTGFGEILRYAVRADWASRTLRLADGATLATIDVPDAGTGDLLLVVTVPPGGGPLVAGRYADTVVIELQVSS